MITVLPAKVKKIECLHVTNRGYVVTCDYVTCGDVLCDQKMLG